MFKYFGLFLTKEYFLLRWLLSWFLLWLTAEVFGIGDRLQTFCVAAWPGILLRPA
jgi:hypothetical protein